MPPSSETLPASEWQTVNLGPPSEEDITPDELGLITEKYSRPSVTKLSFHDSCQSKDPTLPL